MPAGETSSGKQGETPLPTDLLSRSCRMQVFAPSRDASDGPPLTGPPLLRGSREAGARVLESGCPGLSPPPLLLLFQNMCLFGRTGSQLQQWDLRSLLRQAGLSVQLQQWVWFPDQRSTRSALHWEPRVFATGSPRMSSALLLLTAHLTYIIYVYNIQRCICWRVFVCARTVVSDSL